MNFKYRPSVNKRITNMGMLFVLLAVVVLSACNANSGASVSPSAATTKILVVNASPDLGPITLAVGSVQLGGFFRYPTPSNYYSLGTGTQNLQIRNTKYLSVLIRNDTLANNTNYSLYVLGINASTVATESLSAMLVADTSSIPALGYGKIRFINASPRTSGLDIMANGTKAFSAITYKGISAYQQVPAGIYDFKIYAAGSSSVLVDVPRITVQDGRLYTLFTHGLTGRTDTAAIGAAVITNK
jgi:hypothetical protein